MSLTIKGKPTFLGTSIVSFKPTAPTEPDWDNLIEQKVQADDASANSYVGISVSISQDGNTAIIGAYNDPSPVPADGSAYIFVKSGNTWSQQAKLRASVTSNDFGWSVDISANGDTAIVGARTDPGGGSSAGAAFVFTRSGVTWSQQSKIVSDDLEAGDRFGTSVNISNDGNTAIVGAPREDTGGGDAGASYIFTRSGVTWSQQQKIQGSDTAGNNNFGTSVSISGDGNTVLSGSPNINNLGAVYVFTRSGVTWTEQQKIVNDVVQGFQQFGASVSISTDSNTAIIGANNYDGIGADSGQAQIFTRSGNTWTLQQKLSASDESAGDNFGISVNLSADGNFAIVGARYEDTGASNSGAIYIFTRTGNTWTEKKKIKPSDPAIDNNFGISVSISADGFISLTGAFQTDTIASNAGAAYFYS